MRKIDATHTTRGSGKSANITVCTESIKHQKDIVPNVN